jgi:hypothetical protein
MRAYGSRSYPVFGDRTARSGVWDGPSAAAINNPWETDAYVQDAERMQMLAAAREEQAARLAAPAGVEAVVGADVIVVGGDGQPIGSTAQPEYTAKELAAFRDGAVLHPIDQAIRLVEAQA